jgi:hypothetical protein
MVDSWIKRAVLILLTVAFVAGLPTGALIGFRYFSSSW